METSKISPNVNNLSMPRGALSFAPVNDSGVMTGEIDLGNVTSLELTNAIKYKDHMTSHDSVVVLDAKKPSEQQWTLKFAPEERSAENMALFFLGDPDKQKGAAADALTQTSGHITTQSMKAYLDRWLDLGKKYIKPGSIIVSGAVSFSCTLTSSGEDTNCRVDYENGLLMIKSIIGRTTDAQTVNVAFKFGTFALRRFPSRIRPMVGFLRYRGLSEQGPRHAIECWKVQITPDSALAAIKTQDYAGLGFSGDVYIDDDTNGHRATDPFFRVTELSVATAYPS
jgi:hypothetical protein